MSRETNLFPFNYVESQLPNRDVEATKSRFRVVYGNNGKIITCAKDSYHIIQTSDVTNLAQAFLSRDNKVSPFIHKDGEVIGITVNFGEKPSVVGECSYKLIITIPNNGGGKGYLSIKQFRLACSNGMVSSRTLHKNNYIKLPHTIDYKQSIELMKQSVDTYLNMLEQVEKRDEIFNGKLLKDTEVLYHLNDWFYHKELPVSQKTISNDSGNKQDYTFDMFREDLALRPSEIPSEHRYSALMDALKREQGINKDLGLKTSMYTVFATITNYLSRRNELSGSKAPEEIKNQRASAKLSYFDDIMAELSIKA